MRPHSIRARLTLWYTSLLTVTVLILGGAAYELLGYSLERDIDRALQGVAVSLAEQSSRGKSPLPADVEAIFRQFFGFSPWDRYVQRRQPWSDRSPQDPSPHSGTLPLSPSAMHRAAEGLQTFETMHGLGPYP